MEEEKATIEGYCYPERCWKEVLISINEWFKTQKKAA